MELSLCEMGAWDWFWNTGNGKNIYYILLVFVGVMSSGKWTTLTQNITDLTLSAYTIVFSVFHISPNVSRFPIFLNYMREQIALKHQKICKKKFLRHF